MRSRSRTSISINHEESTPNSQTQRGISTGFGDLAKSGQNKKLMQGLLSESIPQHPKNTIPKPPSSHAAYSVETLHSIPKKRQVFTAPFSSTLDCHLCYRSSFLTCPVVTGCRHWEERPLVVQIYHNPLPEYVSACKLATITILS